MKLVKEPIDVDATEEELKHILHVQSQYLEELLAESKRLYDSMCASIREQQRFIAILQTKKIKKVIECETRLIKKQREPGMGDGLLYVQYLKPGTEEVLKERLARDKDLERPLFGEY